MITGLGVQSDVPVREPDLIIILNRMKKFQEENEALVNMLKGKVSMLMTFGPEKVDEFPPPPVIDCYYGEVANLAVRHEKSNQQLQNIISHLSNLI